MPGKLISNDLSRGVVTAPKRKREDAERVARDGAAKRVRGGEVEQARDGREALGAAGYNLGYALLISRTMLKHQVPFEVAVEHVYMKGVRAKVLAADPEPRPQLPDLPLEQGAWWDVPGAL